MSWLILVVAGLLEVGWAIGLKYTHGFTRPIPSILTGIAIAGSMVLLGIAVRSIPLGTAYAVWVGIGVFGTTVLGVAVLGEPATPARLIFVMMLVASVIGLKLTSPAQ